MPHVEKMQVEDAQAVVESGRQEGDHLARGHLVLHYQFFTFLTIEDLYTR